MNRSQNNNKKFTVGEAKSRINDRDVLNGEEDLGDYDDNDERSHNDVFEEDENDGGDEENYNEGGEDEEEEEEVFSSSRKVRRGDHSSNRQIGQVYLPIARVSKRIISSTIVVYSGDRSLSIESLYNFKLHFGACDYDACTIERSGIRKIVSVEILSLVLPESIVQENNATLQVDELVYVELEDMDCNLFSTSKDLQNIYVVLAPNKCFNKFLYFEPLGNSIMTSPMTNRLSTGFRIRLRSRHVDTSNTSDTFMVNRLEWHSNSLFRVFFASPSLMNRNIQVGQCFSFFNFEIDKRCIEFAFLVDAMKHTYIDLENFLTVNSNRCVVEELFYANDDVEKEILCMNVRLLRHQTKYVSLEENQFYLIPMKIDANKPPFVLNHSMQYNLVLRLNHEINFLA